jgi:hypothetical protein
MVVLLLVKELSSHSARGVPQRTWASTAGETPLAKLDPPTVEH